MPMKDEDFKAFEEHLISEGFEPKTCRTYANAAKRMLSEDDPLTLLRSRKLTKRTKVTYHAALRRWAESRGDDVLEEQLSSRAVKKLLNMRGGKPPKTTQGLPEDHVRLILQVLQDEYKEPYESPQDHADSLWSLRPMV